MVHLTAPIPDYSWLSRRQSAVLVLLFSTVLALAPLGWFFDWQGPVVAENRNLAPPPDFRRTRLKDLPAKIDAYYEDHVGFRRAIIRASGIVLHRFFKEPSAEVVIGKPAGPGQPPWYFYAADGILEDRLGLGELTQAQLELWRKSIEARHTYLQRRRIAYLLVVVPEKSSIYPELLPDYIRTRLSRTKLDQLEKYLKDTHSPVNFLNLRPSLIEAKRFGQLYFPFDTHWNGRAMFYAYQAIMSALRPLFPQTSPGLMGRDFEIRHGPESFRIDLATMLGLTVRSPTPLLAYLGPLSPRGMESAWPAGFDPLLHENRGKYVLETPGQRRRLVVFHDSAFVAPLFSPESQPLAVHFGRSYFAWLAPADAAFERFIETEQPDLVVEEHVERVLHSVPPPPAPLDPVTPKLRDAGGRPAYSIDRMNAGRATTDVAIRADGELRIEGWAFDRPTGQPASGVEIVIDGVPQPAAYGLESSEVVHRECGACSRSGFLADVSAHGLSPGDHVLSIRVISADGASYTQATWGRIRIESKHTGSGTSTGAIGRDKSVTRPEFAKLKKYVEE